MDNVIEILIDSAVFEAIQTNSSKFSTTPFIDSIKSQSIFATNMYSQGPYTDAGSKGLYTGENTLDNFGYYFRLNNCKNNHFNVFKQSGYHTVGLFYPFYLYGNQVKKNIDDIYYTSCFEFNSEWNGLYGYYSNILKTRQLNAKERHILIKRIELMFECWISFYDDLLTKTSSGELIKDEYESNDISNSLSTLKYEYSLFLTNEDNYLDEFLSEKSFNKFSKIDKVDIDRNIKKDFIKKYVYKKYRKILKKMQRYDFFSNLKGNRLKFKQIIKGIFLLIKTINIEYLKLFKARLKSYKGVHDSLKAVTNKKWKYVPSARKQLDFAFNKIKELDTSTPFYLSVHLEDLHGDISFFSYDIDDKQIVDSEFLMLSEFVRKNKYSFKGNLAYLLSLKYVDFCIENFVLKLKEANLWDNTTLVLVADHGHPNIGYPIHNIGLQVNTFFKENYHIPFIVHSPKLNTAVIIDDYCYSKDVLPTLCGILGIGNFKFKGINLLENSDKRKCIITEYFGPGCPDPFSREIWFSVRDKNYLVAYKVKLYDDFKDGKIAEVYDLKHDKCEMYDIKTKINLDKISYLLVELENRFNEIKLEYSNEIKFNF